MRVRAYITTDAGTVYSGLTQVDFTTKPKDISSVKLSSATTTSQKLTWSKSSGATHYLVYRYNSSTESYKKLATVTSTSYTVKSLKTKTKYTYKIKPVVMKDGKTVVIVINDTVTEKTVDVPCDTNVKLVVTNDSENLTETVVSAKEIKITPESVNTIIF